MLRSPKLHIVRSPARLADGQVHHYAYLRYEAYEPQKGRPQPKPLASLGRTDRLDPDRLQSLQGFLQEWLRKDSSLPFEALRERCQTLAPAFTILCSRDFGLRWIAEQAWQELGYNDVLKELSRASDKQFRVDLAVFAMVLVQLVSPQSKRGLAEFKGAELFFPEGQQLSLSQLYRALDVLDAGYEQVEFAFNERLRQLGVETESLQQDTSTLSCMVRLDDEERASAEAERQERGEAKRAATVNEPPLRLRGRAKNKRGDLPQIVLEGVLGDHKLIVHHDVHPGNTSDQGLTPKTIAALAKLGYKEVRWAGDAGTNSVSNREALRAARFRFVLGEGVARTKVVKEVLSRAGRYQQHPDRPELAFKCVQAHASEEAENKKDPGPVRLYIIRRNRKEEAHARQRIGRHLKKIEKVLASDSEQDIEGLLRDKTLKRYVKRDGRRRDEEGRAAGSVQLDREAIEEERQLAGKSVIGTDVLDADPLTEDEVYRRLFDVERLFRTLKTTLEIGPVRHRREDRIRAHVMIGVMAYNLGAWLERKSGLTLERLQRVFKNMRVQEVRCGDATYWERVELEALQQEVLAKLGYEEPPKRFQVEVVDEP